MRANTGKEKPGFSFVEGAVGCFVGPAELACSMGVKETGPGTQHEVAMLEVLQAAQKVGKAADKYCMSGGEVAQRIAQGFQFLGLSSDAGMRQV